MGDANRCKCLSNGGLWNVESAYFKDTLNKHSKQMIVAGKLASGKDKFVEGLIVLQSGQSPASNGAYKYWEAMDFSADEKGTPTYGCRDISSTNWFYKVAFSDTDPGGGSLVGAAGSYYALIKISAGNDPFPLPDPSEMTGILRAKESTIIAEDVDLGSDPCDGI